MQVILLERVAKLGQMGDVVNVKPGYARNYLLPQGKALRASNDNIKSFEVRKAELEAQNLETRKEAQAVAARLEGETYVVIRQASDGGALYGSVSPRDVADLLAEAGVKIDRRQIVITTPIKVLGLHTALINLHPEVDVEVGLNVARSAEEAELQASGKSIQELAAEEEAAAEFEISELFDDIGAAGMDEDDQRGSDEQRES
ncbi:50S ribosomal protein L9 [Roseinatronobacter bogoriensis]|uniref:Large ribosomal subunit protein bL9 n=1 Tax=Roseinatronobacter bogoriensis subsp. barguzinensis TaxID=441209 RepID=A0A2K8KBQ4_9RHOB|nr:MULTISPECIES: 50S ribosomal protein L9 [Rhodobaca]ATX66416.1 50S ribosomal protein L9 [Rhodobaca barguzinensis]MBB4207558.1 large subunit ribosomal protein L9 [Rhodobaca bogoriensis DSM 18756]TDW40135.1 large subunit ribosomal protein L9 [Rhodobaca barguzinensis]TDY70713.1 LSU ribosomal protein L9P [Rhodobaca bogoriensis DSM 18756]